MCWSIENIGGGGNGVLDPTDRPVATGVCAGCGRVWTVDRLLVSTFLVVQMVVLVINKVGMYAKSQAEGGHVRIAELEIENSSVLLTN